MKRLALSVVAAALMLTGLTACGGQPVTYVPAAYGQNNQCYYVNDPSEVIALQQAGLCPRSWTPFLMPLYWHQMYYPYYSSPAYYTHYVPVSTRTVFVQHETVFKTQYSSQIKTASAKARYKGSNGKVVTGNKISTSKFGGGSRTRGGGSRTKTCGMSQAQVPQSFLGKGGGGFGGGSRSSGGGGSRSGGGGSRTTSRTRTGGC